MGIQWKDIEDIAVALMEKYPATDPLSVNFHDLKKWITELEDFDDDPKASNEKKLEAVQMAWFEEYKQ
jgi:FeS assembly protein IscX